MFVLRIPITSTNLSLLKVEIGQRLPDVKSSHRCEAIARGLGFNTYAAFRAAAQSPNASSVTASASEFQSYLVEKGFSAPLKPFYVAVARLAVSAVLLRAPKLTSHGIGIGRPRRTPNGSWESLEQRQVKFAEGRKELLCDRYIEAFILCLDFLSLVGRTKTIRPRTNSYWIKHIAENFHCAYPEGEMLGPKYVPNGVLIAAAMHAGFNLKTHDDGTGFDSLNVTFNMSEPSLKRLDQEIRQRGRAAA